MEVIDYPNYLIYDDGRVQNKKTGRILKHCINTQKRRYVSLRKNDKYHNNTIHRLVAIHYIPNPNNYTEVDHIDKDPTNNHVSNLRWCNHSQNNQNKGVCKNNKSTGIKNISAHNKIGYRFIKGYQGVKHQKWFRTLDEAIKYKEEFYKNLDDEFCRKD